MDKNQLDSKNNNDTFALWNENTKEREKTRKTSQLLSQIYG